MTGWFCSSRGRGEKCFENGAIQKIVLFAVCSDSAAMADITCIQKYTGDFCPGPGCEVLPQNLTNLSGLWMGEECPVPPAPPFPNFRPFLQSFSPGIKLLQGCGGIWAAGAEGDFFFFFKFHTTFLCKNIPDSITARANAQGNSPFMGVSAWGDNISHALPDDRTYCSSGNQRFYISFQLFCFPLLGNW